MNDWLPAHWFQVSVVLLLAGILWGIGALFLKAEAAIELLQSANYDLAKIASVLDADARDRRLEEEDRVAHYRASVRRP